MTVFYLCHLYLTRRYASFALEKQAILRFHLQRYEELLNVRNMLRVDMMTSNRGIPGCICYRLELLL